MKKDDHNSENSEDLHFRGTLRRALAAPIVNQRSLQDRVACYLFILLGEMSLVRDDSVGDCDPAIKYERRPNRRRRGALDKARPGELSDLHIKCYLKTSRVSPRDIIYYIPSPRPFLFFAFARASSLLHGVSSVFYFDHAARPERNC